MISTMLFELSIDEIQQYVNDICKSKDYKDEHELNEQSGLICVIVELGRKISHEAQKRYLEYIYSSCKRRYTPNTVEFVIKELNNKLQEGSEYNYALDYKNKDVNKGWIWEGYCLYRSKGELMHRMMLNDEEIIDILGEYIKSKKDFKNNSLLVDACDKITKVARAKIVYSIGFIEEDDESTSILINKSDWKIYGEYYGIDFGNRITNYVFDNLE